MTRLSVLAFLTLLGIDNAISPLRMGKMINVELSFHVYLLSPRDPCPQNRGRHTGGCRYPVDALRQLVKGEQVCLRKLDPDIHRDDDKICTLHTKNRPGGRF